MENIFQQLANTYELSLVTNLKNINEHLTDMKISELWSFINSKKSNFKKNNHDQNSDNMQEEDQNFVSYTPPEPIKYISNILEVLAKVKFQLSGIEAEKLNELYAGVYEGGFLLWECERDAVEYLHYSGWLDNFDHVAKHDAKILEIGCGSGLVGVYLLQQVIN